MSILESLEDEHDYFFNHPEYQKLDNLNEVAGIPALVNKISLIMNKHIKRTLPSII